MQTLVLGAAVLALTAAEASPARGADGPSVSLRLSGGERASAPVCGRARSALVVARASTARARIIVRPRARRKLTLRIRRCGEPRSRLLARRRRAGGLIARLPTRAPGAYRLIARARGERRSGRRAVWVLVERRVVDVPVRFEVLNTNRSRLACPSDGEPYTVSGRLVAPARVLRARDPAVTLHLHEFGWGAFFWSFPRAGWDYARAQAEAGHASIVVDRLGYDASGHPPGTDTCLGSQADVAGQIVEDLHAGTYSGVGTQAPRFTRVALAGHSGGGAIAELAAASFAGADALILFAYADQGFTNRSIAEANEQGLACAAGGEPAEPGGPGGYAYFAQTEEEWRSFMFTSADPEIAAAAAAMRNRDPCGDSGSLTPAAVTNYRAISEIDIPVLLLYGTSDAIYEQPGAGEQQRDLFSGSDDVTLRFFAGTGHALTLEAAAPEVRAVVHGWLQARGL